MIDDYGNSVRGGVSNRTLPISTSYADTSRLSKKQVETKLCCNLKSILFYTLPSFNRSLLNNEFVAPARHVNKFNGVIVA